MVITSSRNEVVQSVRRLQRKRGDRAILEGPHLLAEALAAGLAVETLLATPAFLASADGRKAAGALARPALAIEDRLLASLADADSPRGALAVIHLPRSGIETLPVVAGGLYLYLDGLQDPGNLGALARVAEAAGCHGLALAAGCAHPNHPRALRASAGSLLRLPVAIGVGPPALGERLGRAGEPPRWLALVPRGGRNLWQVDLGERSRRCHVVALGAEGPGLSAGLAGTADERVTVPTAPPIESLNATVAAALVLFERRRRSLEQGRLLAADGSPAADGAWEEGDDGDQSSSTSASGT